jgi:hypothetical protein
MASGSNESSGLVLSVAHGETRQCSAYIDAKAIHNARRVWDVGLLAKKMTIVSVAMRRQMQGTTHGS